MASRADDIQALLARSADTHARIKSEYSASLQKKEIPTDLRLDVKHMLEMLRSVLDYLACDIRETHCPSASVNARFYFPILPDQPTFKKRFAEWFPGLDTTSPGLTKYLESIQPYQRGFEWLGQLNRINNTNKHDRLAAQERRERPGGARITTPAVGSVSWKPGVRFTRGVSIMGAVIDPESQLPVPRPGQVVERIVWVDFTFDGTAISVQRMLESGQDGIVKIAADIRKWL